MSRHGGGGYEELDYEADQPVSVWRPEFAGVLVPEVQEESLREAATEPGTAPADPNGCQNPAHADCGALVSIDETGRHCHENEDGRCWHDAENPGCVRPEELEEGAEIIVDRSGWNDPDGYHQSVRTVVVCPYCQSTTHRGSAWTANGSDVERFDRLHPNEPGKRPGGDSY